MLRKCPDITHIIVIPEWWKLKLVFLFRYPDMHIIWISRLTWLKVTYSEITMKSQGMEYCSESESLVLTSPWHLHFVYEHLLILSSWPKSVNFTLSSFLAVRRVIKVINSISLLNLYTVNQFDVLLFSFTTINKLTNFLFYPHPSAPHQSIESDIGVSFGETCV